MRWLIFVCSVMWVAGASAASQVPMTPADHAFVRALYERWYLPNAVAFSGEAQKLTASLRTLCDTPEDAAALGAARTQWRATVETWERFSAVRGGALLARRSPREIDFMPTRPESIQRAIDGGQAMELIGTPAKGLPALEWLLWTQPVKSGTPGCRYAVQVSVEVAAEGDALRAAYANALQHGWDDEELEYALYEFLNLFDAGVQKLWWEDMDRPRQKAATGGNRKASFSRKASGTSVAAWRAHWRGLRSLAVGTEVASLHAYLIAKGHPSQAQQLLPLVANADKAMDALARADDDAHIADAITSLKALQNHVENDMANALQFVISFFDEDGD